MSADVQAVNATRHWQHKKVHDYGYRKMSLYIRLMCGLLANCLFSCRTGTTRTPTFRPRLGAY